MMSKTRINDAIRVAGIIVAIEQYLVLFLYRSPFIEIPVVNAVPFSGLVDNAINHWSALSLIVDFSLGCLVPILLFSISTNVFVNGIALFWYLLMLIGSASLIIHLGEFKAGVLYPVVFEGWELIHEITFVVCLVTFLIIGTSRLIRKNTR